MAVQQEKAVLRERGLIAAKELIEAAERKQGGPLLSLISRFALGTLQDSIGS